MGAMVIGIMAAMPATAHAQCGQTVKYVPIPETRGATVLWPAHLRPADVAGIAIPADRDSTAYDSQQFPAAINGLELFWAVAAADQHVFVGYNVGLSVWDPSGAQVLQRKAFADHISNQWFGSHTSGEADGFLQDIAAARDPVSGRTAIAVASLAPVGISLWSWDPVAKILVQHYQDADATLDASGESTNVTLAERGGKLYAFSAANNIAEVFDVSAALALPTACGDRPRGTCPGIARGAIGAGEKPGQYVSSLSTAGGVLVATSAGAIMTSPVPKIVRLADPASPGGAGAVTVWTGTNGKAGPAELFHVDGKDWMALIDANVLTVYPLGACTSSADCVGAPAATFDLPADGLVIRSLQFSEVGGRGVLYQAVKKVLPGPGGPTREQVLDLGAISSGKITDLAAGGGAYAEACDGATVDYFADAYHGNEHGFKNVYPHAGVVIDGQPGPQLVRAAYGILDVHDVTFPPLDPTTTSTSSSSTGSGSTGATGATAGASTSTGTGTSTTGTGGAPSVADGDEGSGCDCSFETDRAASLGALPLALGLLTWGARRRLRA